MPPRPAARRRTRAGVARRGPATSAGRAALALALLAAVPPFAAAQRPPVPLAPQWELRGDATVAPRPAGHAGVGVNVRAGSYVRLGAAVLAGVARGPAGDPDPRFSQRADASARFLLDPFAEQARGWYGGAGFTARRDGDAAWKGDLMLVIGVEGAARGRWIPAVEAALGGGVRVGVVLRTRRVGSPSR